MPGISIHVVDVSRGIVAQGMDIEVYAIEPGGARSLVAKGATCANGTLADPRLAKTLAPGQLEAVFYVGDSYKAARIALPGVPFLDVVTYRFGIADPAQHYHLPFKCTPWGYSCFRGGA
jgi:5-hydroxyisourate hydrolase